MNGDLGGDVGTTIGRVIGVASIALFAGASCWAGVNLFRTWFREVLNKDTYNEILLRLPADRPRLRGRLAVVCRTWRTILADPKFIHSYRLFHRLPHLVGYIYDLPDRGFGDLVRFVVTTNDPNFRPRVPQDGIEVHVHDSRHGRVILTRFGRVHEEPTFIIWDPVADRHEEVRRPEPFRQSLFDFTASVLCDAPGCDHVDCRGGPFRVVFVGIRDVEGASAMSVFNYCSATASWTESPAAAAAATDELNAAFPWFAPTTLVGATTLYFRSPRRILRYRFGDEVEDLVYVDIPPFIAQRLEPHREAARGTVLMPAADGRLCFVALCNDMRMRFWETKVGADGAVDWVLTQNALLDNPPVSALIGATESLLFIRTQDDDIITIDLGSGRLEMFQPAVRKTSADDTINVYRPRLLPPPRAEKICSLIPFMSSIIQ